MSSNTNTRNISLLCLGLLAASQSANLIRIGDAHPVAIAAWRLIMAGVILGMLARSKLFTVLSLTKKEWGILVAASVFLALHLITWIASVQLTTVANATIIFSINPVITAVLGYLILSEPVTRKLIIAIALGLTGVVIAGWEDISLGGDIQQSRLIGDISSVFCAFFASGYFLMGKRIMAKLETKVYVTFAYTIAALFCFSVLVVLDVPIVQYSAQTWLCFGLMALIPTVMGHTLLNRSIRIFGAAKVSTATMSEPLMAAVVAYFAWSESIGPYVLVGYVFIVASVVVLAMDMKKSSQS